MQGGGEGAAQDADGMTGILLTADLGDDGGAEVRSPRCRCLVELVGDLGQRRAGQPPDHHGLPLGVREQCDQPRLPSRAEQGAGGIVAFITPSSFIGRGRYGAGAAPG